MGSGIPRSKARIPPGDGAAAPAEGGGTAAAASRKRGWGEPGFSLAPSPAIGRAPAPLPEPGGAAGRAGLGRLAGASGRGSLRRLQEPRRDRDYRGAPPSASPLLHFSVVSFS